MAPKSAPSVIWDRGKKENHDADVDISITVRKPDGGKGGNGIGASLGGVGPRHDLAGLRKSAEEDKDAGGHICKAARRRKGPEKS